MLRSFSVYLFSCLFWLSGSSYRNGRWNRRLFLWNHAPGNSAGRILRRVGHKHGFRYAHRTMPAPHGLSSDSSGLSWAVDGKDGVKGAFKIQRPCVLDGKRNLFGSRDNIGDCVMGRLCNGIRETLHFTYDWIHRKRILLMEMFDL